MSFYRPNAKSREEEKTKNEEKALLFIDVQNYNMNPDGTLLKQILV